MMRPSSMVLASLLLLSACGGGGSQPGSGSGAEPTKVDATTPGGGSGGGTGGGTPGPSLTVMTRNLYLGADIQRLVAVTDPAELPAAVGAMWQVIQDSDFPARAEAIADEIGTSSPHLVSLQEVSLYRTGPPDSCQGKQEAATVVALDYLAILQDALAARGLDYTVAAQVQNLDAELCAKLGAESFSDVRLTDRDVILVRGDQTFANPRSGNYAEVALLPVGGGSVAVQRGWASVDVTSPLGALRFVATHLEVEAFAVVQQAQAAELVTRAADGLGDMPVVLAGDFNAGPELATVTTSYDDLLAAGYLDPWPALNPAAAGFTCCFDELLRSGALTHRIDLTLYQGDIVPRASARVGLDRNTEPGFYPSDHAGVVTTFSASSGGECPGDEECECPCECEHHHDHGDCGEHHGDCGEHHGDCGEHHGDCGEHHGDCGEHHGDGACHEDCGNHRGHGKCEKGEKDEKGCDQDRTCKHDCGHRHGDCGEHEGKACEKDEKGCDQDRTCKHDCGHRCHHHCCKHRDRCEGCRPEKCHGKDGRGRGEGKDHGPCGGGKREGKKG